MNETERIIVEQFYSLFPQNFGELKIPVRYKISEIAKNVCICRYGKINEEIIKNIQRSISDNFDIHQDGDKNFFLLSRKYKTNQLFFLEPRYFSLETCIELAISSGMNEDDFFKFTKLLMGMNWIYLRNPEYLVGSYCIKFGLSASDYYELREYASKKRNEITDDRPLQTRITIPFMNEYDNFIKGITQKEYSRSISPIIIKRNIRKFIRDHITIICQNSSNSETAENLENFLKNICIKFLTPKDYNKLKTYTKRICELYKNSLNNNTQNEIRINEDLKSECAEFEKSVENIFNKSRQSIKDEMKPFLESHIQMIQGNITRMLEYFRQIVTCPTSGSWLSKQNLNPQSIYYNNSNNICYSDHLIKITFPWEYKKTDPTQISDESNIESNIKGILDLIVETDSVHNQFQKYFNTEKLLKVNESNSVKQGRRRVDMGREVFTANQRFENINMRRFRNDFIRILIMDMTETQSIKKINNLLQELSFYPLRKDDPFDFLVIEAIEIYKSDNKTEEYRNNEPYEILVKLFDLIKDNF